MKKTTTILIVLTIISKIFGFAREATLSYYYGASNISDAFLISLTIPTVIFSFIGTGLYTGYIPMYSRIKREHGEDGAIKYTNNLVNIILAICTILVVFALLFTEPLVKMFALGFEGETLALAVRFTKISMLGIYFTALLYIYNGFLRLHESYIPSALTGLPLNLITIATIFISAKSDIMVLAIGSLLAIASQFIMLIPFAKGKGLKYEFVIDIKDEYIKDMALVALPIIIGASIDQVNILIDRTMASNIAVGGITALNYGSKLNGFIHGIFVQSISTVMYPMISQKAIEKDTVGLKKILRESMNMVSLLVVPAAIGAMVFSEPIVKFFFARGAFDLEAKLMTSSVFFYYSVGSIGFGYRNILSRAFYSMEDTKTPMINGIIAVIVNVTLNIVLSKFLGLGGLALASSIAAITASLLLFINLRRRIGKLGAKEILLTLTKITCASFIMGIGARLSFSGMQAHLGFKVSLLGSIVLGALIYGIIISFMNIEEVDALIEDVKNRFIKS